MSMPPINYEKRVEKIRDQMKEKDLDVIVVTRNPSRRYVSGMGWYGLSRGAVVIPLEGEVAAIVLVMQRDRPRLESWITNVKFFVPYPYKKFPKFPYEKVLVDTLKEMKLEDANIGLELAGRGVEQLGGQGLGLGERAILSEKLPHAKIRDAADVLNDIMAIKEPAEIARLRRAAELVDIGTEAAYKALEPGKRETEIAKEVARAMFDAGAETSEAGASVASGYRSLVRGPLPASTKIIQRGDIVNFDISLEHQLYFGDINRTVIMGKPTKEYEKIAEAAHDMAMTTLDALVPGAVAGDVDKLARDCVFKRGLDEYESCWITGHEIGCFCPGGRAAHFLVPGADWTVKPNMVTTINEGLFGPKYAILFETAVWVREKKAEVLSKIPIELKIIE